MLFVNFELRIAGLFNLGEVTAEKFTELKVWSSLDLTKIKEASHYPLEYATTQLI